MHTLAEIAAAALARHPSAALPLDELVREMRASGTVVGPEVLTRALEARPDLFRVLDPWRGAWRAGWPSGSRAAGRSRWVVGLRRRSGAVGPHARIEASLAWLGRRVDERSTTDLVRWLGMVREGERLSRPRPAPRDA